jgi:hypothetical protein
MGQGCPNSGGITVPRRRAMDPRIEYDPRNVKVSLAKLEAGPGMGPSILGLQIKTRAVSGGNRRKRCVR